MFLNAIGKFPDRLRNLFFLYAAIIRAINRAEPILRAFDYETKINAQEDSSTPLFMK